MRKISAVIITYNEEKNIEACLKSLSVVADEIIVVDSFSTDKTQEICLKYNVVFTKHEFDGHIQQKNRAVELAKHNFVLSLDADEILSPELQKSILVEKGKLNFDSYYFNRLNIYCGKEIRTTNWYPDKKTRLWNKNKGQWGGVNPHDKVMMQKHSVSKFLSGDLKHYSFNSIDEHIAQANKFSSISAKEILLKNKKYLAFRMIANPAFSFFKNYFLKKGFLGGYYGFVISIIIAFENFLKYAKAFYLKNKKTN